MLGRLEGEERSDGVRIAGREGEKGREEETEGGRERERKVERGRGM